MHWYLFFINIRQPAHFANGLYHTLNITKGNIDCPSSLCLVFEVKVHNPQRLTYEGKIIVDFLDVTRALAK